MAKNAKLDFTEIFYIQQNPENLTAQELAQKMGRSLNVIKKYLNDGKPRATQVESQPEQVVEEQKPQPKPKGPNARRAFGHVRKRGQSLATVMTPAASEIGDEASKLNRRKLGDIPALKNAIHRPYGDDNGE